MCTRTLFVSDEGVVITGRNMDWKEDMRTNLWAFPAGTARDGAAGPNSLRWTSKYGSVIAAGYDIGTPDGMNEAGLVTNALYLVESEYAAPVAERPFLSISLWAQYALDSFATVAEAVAEFQRETFNLLAPPLPNGVPTALHLALSDATGDSAILEYVGGKLVIHHGHAYTVMTNSPIYDQQLALVEYWKSIGGLAFLPGTNRAADRFARAAFYLEAIPRKPEPQYMAGVPGRTFAHQALASVLSLQRAVSVPLGITTPDQPNISSTIWRTISDHKEKVYYFDSATRPNTFWVRLDKLNLKPGNPVLKLAIADGEVFAGEVSKHFAAGGDMHFMPASPPA